jgi:hypothetical protein
MLNELDSAVLQEASLKIQKMNDSSKPIKVGKQKEQKAHFRGGTLNSFSVLSRFSLDPTHFLGRVLCSIVSSFIP